MQQTKSYWQLVAVAGVVAAFIGSACTVTTSTDDDTAGAAGAGTAGSGTAGGGAAGSGAAGASAGTAGTAGAAAGSGGAGPVPFQCDPGEGGAVGTPNTCAPSDADDVCQKCIQSKCCSEIAACYATDPGNQCGWGGPATVDGATNEGGELFCVQACLQKIVEANQTAPEDSDVQKCANNCATTLTNGATKECGPVPGIQTSDAVGCLLSNCSEQCFGA